MNTFGRAPFVPIPMVSPPGSCSHRGIGCIHFFLAGHVPGRWRMLIILEPWPSDGFTLYRGSMGRKGQNERVAKEEQTLHDKKQQVDQKNTLVVREYV